MGLLCKFISMLGVLIVSYGLISFIASMFGFEIVPIIWKYSDSFVWFVKCLITGMGMFLLMMSAVMKANSVKSEK